MKEHDLSTQTTEDVIYAAEYTWQLILPNTEPDICDLWHPKRSYFRSIDTLRKQRPFPFTHR